MSKKILVISQYYYPEPVRITDICEELVKRGNEVEVVTDYPNYPEGKIYEGYGINKHIDEVINGVKVHRCFTIPRKKNDISRFFNYHSYPISSKNYVLSSKCHTSDNSHYDAVLVNQLSPVMMASPALAYKKKYGVPVVLYCLDLWPDSLTAGGIKRDSLIYRHYFKVSKNIYTSVDKLLVTSKSFINYFIDTFNIDKDKLYYLPQYAEDSFKDIKFKEKGDIYNFTFAGNIGKAQAIDTILLAANELKDKPIKFTIVGSGIELDRLIKLKEDLNLTNVTFTGRLPLDKMPEIYENSDCMLVSLYDDKFISMTLPGKIQTYMASGKPIIGSINGEGARIINEAKCGYVSNALDYKALATNITKFINSDIKQMCINSKGYYLKHFDKSKFMDELEEYL